MKKSQLLCALLLTSVPAMAFADDLNQLTERTQKATATLSSYLDNPQTAIPDEILAHAECVLVIPTMVKAGLIVGVDNGDGLASCRSEAAHSWSAPSFTSLTGVKAGFVVGVDVSTAMLVFTNPQIRDELVTGHFDFGAHAGAVIGVEGKDAKVITPTTPLAAIYSYSMDKGAYLDLSLDGSTLSTSQKDNAIVYGDDVDTYAILSGDQKAPVPAFAAPFVQILNQYAPQ